MNDSALLTELTPVAERLLERHLRTAKEWFPHELVPWSRGRDFVRGEPVTLEKLPGGVRSALFVNLLTEDNLPYYFSAIEKMFGSDGAWGTWVRRWTAEEGRHSIVIRDYLTIARKIDPVQLERARMAQVCGGVVPQPTTAADTFAYLTLQELATRIAHHNTGKSLDDPAGYEVMKRVAADENLHFLFYRDMVSAALEVDPSGTVEAIARQAMNFDMPGVGIVGFAEHARAIARERIYDLAIHYEGILEPLLSRHWSLDAFEGLTTQAQATLDRLRRYLGRFQRAASRIGERSAEQQGTTAPQPQVLDATNV
jgi:acyl-[acyl-carrier-protein] desaturase